MILLLLMILHLYVTFTGVPFRKVFTDLGFCVRHVFLQSPTFPHHYLYSYTVKGHR